ncbi:MAG: nucleotidyltransferase domain-containing protein [Phycisphaerae bacterium]
MVRVSALHWGAVRTLQDIPLAENDREAIEAAVRLLQGAFPVEQVILFGSKARGSGDEESDIDLLVLTSRKLDWPEEDAITAALFDVELAHDVVISTLIIPADEWVTGVYRVLPIHDEIGRDGVAA